MDEFKHCHEGCQAALVQHCYYIKLQWCPACEKTIEVMAKIVATCVLAFAYKNASN